MYRGSVFLLRAEEIATSPERQRRAGPSLLRRAGIRSARAGYLVAALAAMMVPAAEGNEATIRRQIERIKESEVNGWRTVPWTASLLAARRASEREKQPIFLFTYCGNMETGRC
jgi:hypothetical protein